MPSFTGDALVSARRFTGNAVIIGPRWRHDRTLDHTGSQDDTTVVLSEAIGPYPAGMVLHEYLVALTDRVVSLENSTRYWGLFTGDAVLTTGGAFSGNAVIAARRFTGDGVIKAPFVDNLTGDAVISTGIRTFTGDAFLV